MRDHPAHSAYMLGGTWGAKVNHQRPAFKEAFRKMFKDGISYVSRQTGGGYDQVALTRYVWPWAKKVALCHDSYTCHKFSKTVAFPTRREEGVGNFIGSVISYNSSISLDEGGICPEKCRPKTHPDWIYCWLDVLLHKNCYIKMKYQKVLTILMKSGAPFSVGRYILHRRLD